MRIEKIRGILQHYALLLLSLTSACLRSTTTQEKVVSAKEDADNSQSQQLQNQKLQNQIKQISLATKGSVGVAAVMLETGDTLSLNPNDHFPMQSVYKLPIGMAVIQQVDVGRIRREHENNDDQG